MKTVYKGKIVTLKLKDIKFSDGHKSQYEFILHKPAVAVVPVFDNNKILLIRQFRPVIKKKIWELPAGLIDKGETPISAAKRELEEETGYKAEKIFKIAEVFSSPGFTNEKTDLFVAKRLVKTKQMLDADEEIEIKIFSIDELLKMVQDNTLVDAKTIMGILMTIKVLNLTL